MTARPGRSPHFSPAISRQDACCIRIGNPNRPPSTRRAERVRKRGGGSADLRVRSAGYPSAETRPNGPPKTLNRKCPIDPHPHVAPKGSERSVAGARTSVSARWMLIRRNPSQWAGKRHGSANTPPPGTRSDHLLYSLRLHSLGLRPLDLCVRPLDLDRMKTEQTGSQGTCI